MAQGIQFALQGGSAWVAPDRKSVAIRASHQSGNVALGCPVGTPGQLRQLLRQRVQEYRPVTVHLARFDERTGGRSDDIGALVYWSSCPPW
jgi:hypothetical protein